MRSGSTKLFLRKSQQVYRTSVASSLCGHRRPGLGLMIVPVLCNISLSEDSLTGQGLSTTSGVTTKPPPQAHAQSAEAQAQSSSHDGLSSRDSSVAPHEAAGTESLLQPESHSALQAGVSSQSEMEQQVREWGRMRKERLTASVFAFAIGFWEGRRVQLWQEKIGLKEPFQGNSATDWGTSKEPVAIQRYIQLTENKVKHEIFRSYPRTGAFPDWMGCSPDGLVEGNMRQPLLLEHGGILEVKCPFNKGNPEEAVPWPYVPHYYIPQAQGLMEIYDRNWLDFYVWTMNGSSVYRIMRDEVLWELMLTALNDFWWAHVVPARHYLSEDPLANVRRYKPGPHHALYLTIANRCKHAAARCPMLVNDTKDAQRTKLVR